MRIIVSEPSAGFEEYRQKRDLDLLTLGGACGFGGLRLDEWDWDHAIDLFPVACNTAVGVQDVFPAATTAPLQRQALKLLCRASAHHGAPAPVARMAVMVCFDQKEQTGAMQLIR